MNSDSPISPSWPSPSSGGEGNAAAGWRFCIAPMMDRTDRHCRYFMRLFTRHTRLYTEMVTAQALLHGDMAALLRFHPAEHPLALQLGGSDPAQLAQCAKRGSEWGYDEINLNAGCPSDRVRAGRFGACLMAEPELVADCVVAMREQIRLPITVKTRLGIDHQDSYDFLHRFVSRVHRAGVDTFILHARKAWLSGLSPRQNREVPPLDYARVHRLKADFPNLRIVINGGFRRLADLPIQLQRVDGVMMGRAAYADPYLLSRVDALLFDRPRRVPSREDAARRYARHMDSELRRSTPLSAMIRPLLGLFQGEPGARAWRRFISTRQSGVHSASELVEGALQARHAGESADGSTI